MITQELHNWANEHADLTGLCQIGGWPDGESLRVEICQRCGNTLEVNIYFDEVLQEMSECIPSRIERCGKFCITMDEHNRPLSVQLLYPM